MAKHYACVDIWEYECEKWVDSKTNTDNKRWLVYSEFPITVDTINSDTRLVETVRWNGDGVTTPTSYEWLREIISLCIISEQKFMDMQAEAQASEYWEERVTVLDLDDSTKSGQVVTGAND